MQWGVRNDRSGNRKGRSTKETKARIKRQKISNTRRTISDDDIRKHISRLSDEKKLKNLIAEDLKPGRTIAKKVLSDSGQKVARTVIGGAGVYAVKRYLDKKADPKSKIDFMEVAKYVAPKPKNK